MSLSTILIIVFATVIVIESEKRTTAECAKEYTQQMTTIFGTKYMDMFKNVMLPSLEVISNSLSAYLCCLLYHSRNDSMYLYNFEFVGTFA